MFRILRVAVLALFIPAICSAGNFGHFKSCNTGHCYTPVSTAKVIYPDYVQKQVNVEYSTSHITFVPSQVLLNGQVVTYGNYAAASPTAIGYSFQGQPVQQVQQTQPVQQAQPSLEERLARIEAALTGGQQDESGQSQPDQNQPQNYNVSDVVEIFKKHCASCHSQGGSGYFDLPLFLANGNLPNALPRFDIYESVSKQASDDGFMPKGGNQLSPSEREKIRIWAQQGLKGHSY